MGWSGLANGKLMTTMHSAGFDIMVTCDQNLSFQQGPGLPVGLIVLAVPNNRVQTVIALAPHVLEALGSISPGQMVILRP